MSESLLKLGDGLVHVMSPIGGGEHTLCGIAMDAADSEADEGMRWLGHAQGPVSCIECAAVVLHCRGLRVAHGATKGLT